MLARHAIDGGAGGKPGRNGLGGSGGPGGSGGSSYSWTETDSDTDLQGHRTTRTTHHSNAGGSDGSSGRAGLPGNAELARGWHGKLGTFAICVAAGGRKEAYASRYDLRLVGFAHRSANEDGIYEPEEKIHISKIEIENVGGMPTPAHREIRVSLREKGWITAGPGHLVLPPSLGPGQRHVFGEELTCTLGTYHPSKPSDALAEAEVIRHRAFVPDARREFTAYESPQSEALGRFLIRFPIEISPLETLHSLAPGQAARIRFRVTNISRRAFGSQSELGRAIAFRLFLHHSELGDSELLFFDGEGTRVHLDTGFRREIAELGPEQSMDVEGTIAVPEDAPHYRAGRMWLSLELGGIDRPSSVRPIQYRAFDVRVGRPFSQDTPKDVLLAVNNRTTAEELAAWEQLAGALGLQIGVLDLSLQGAVDFEAPDSHGRSLGRNLRGRTFVLLNNAVDTPKGERQPIQYVSKSQLLDLAAAGGHAMIAGDTPDLEALLVPTPARNEASSNPASWADEYIGDMRRGAAHELPVGRAPSLVEVSKWSWLWWGKPSDEALRRRTMKLRQSLENAYPHRRHVLVWELSPQQTADYWMAARWRMGAIHVYRTLDRGHATIVSTGVHDVMLHQASHVLGRANTMGLLLALPFDEKLRRLEYLTRPEAPPAQGTVLLATLVADAILVDLAQEQLNVLRRGWCAGATPRSLETVLPSLRRFVNRLFPSSDGDIGAEQSAQAIRLLARLHFFASSQIRLWEYIPPLRFERRAPVLHGVMLRLVDKLVRRIFGGSNPNPSETGTRVKAAHAAIAAARKSLEQRYRQAKKHGECSGNRAEFVRDLLLGPIAREGITADVEVLRTPPTQVMPRQEHDALCEQDRTRAKRRRTLMARAADAREELLRPESCAALMAAARQAADKDVLVEEALPADRGVSWLEGLPREQRS
jgi:hypothetical protein